jgi:hypothetical protein
LNSNTTGNNLFSSSLKPNYKSTPVIKNNNLNNIIEENKNILTKELYHSNKVTENKNIVTDLLNVNQLSTSPNKKSTPKNLTSGNLTKNAHVNLWRKPLVVGVGVGVGSGTTITNATGTNNYNLNGNYNSTGNSTTPNQSDAVKNMFKISKQKITTYNSNNNPSKNYLNTNSYNNQISTNCSESNKDKEIIVDYKTTSPKYNFIETPKNKDNSKFNRQFTVPNTNNDYNNYLSNHNTNLNINTNEIINNNIQSEILSSILNFKSLLKSNESANNIEKLFKSEESMNKINQLNMKLNSIGSKYGNNVNMINTNINMVNTLGVTNNINISSNNYSYLSQMGHTDNNVVSSNTSCRFNNVNVINANMLSDGFSPKVEKKLNDIKEEEDSKSQNQNKDKILNEIYHNSDIRIKRYEILLDFITANLKEINQIVNTSTNNSQHQIKNKSNNGPVLSQDTNLMQNNILPQEDLVKIEEVNSDKLSSLHSKINLTSKTNLNPDKENLYDYEDSEMQEKSNVILPAGNMNGRDYLNFNLNLNLNLSLTPDELIQPVFAKRPSHKREPSPSLLISSINSEFYKNLMDDSFAGGGGINNHLLLNNISNEMSSFVTQNEHIKKLERMISFGSDRTPLQYITKNKMELEKISQQVKSGNINFIPNLRPNVKSDLTNNEKLVVDIITLDNKEEYDTYNEGEENIDESDLDKTKENIQVLDTK